MNAAVPSGEAFDLGRLGAALAWLAHRDIFIGTSSWKYEGWLGRLYSPGLYLTRGKLSVARFQRECLREYARTFHTVCVDAGYYRFPSPDWISRLMEQTPETFQFTYKVTDDITARTFPNLPRHGNRAGQRNENFLNADLFQQTILQTLMPWKERTGTLIFEFSRFHERDFARGRDFIEALDQFFAALPRGWMYGVEIRNRTFLQPEYFEVLQRHGVTHVLNQWTRMPDVSEQMTLPGSLDAAPHLAARFLLRQGRTFEEAVQAFSPYTAVKDPFDTAREAAAELVKYVLKLTRNRNSKPRRKLFLYVNNRLEGNALETIYALLTQFRLLPDDIPPPPSPTVPQQDQTLL